MGLVERVSVTKILRSKRWRWVVGLAIFSTIYVIVLHCLHMTKSTRTISNAQSVDSSMIHKPRFPAGTKIIRSLNELQNLQRVHFSGFGNGTIPKIVHLIYPTIFVPEQYLRLLQHCVTINPDVTFLFWTEEQAGEFVKQQTMRNANQEERTLPNLLVTNKGVKKVDVLRLMLMYFLGGVHMHLDTECKLPFTGISQTLGRKMQSVYREHGNSEGVACMLDQPQWLQTRVHWSMEYAADNSLMMCRPNHPFFRYIIYTLKNEDIKKWKIIKSGSFLLTKRYQEYSDLLTHSIKLSNATKAEILMHMNDKVELAHPDWFSPMVDTITTYEEQCRASNNNGRNKWFIEGCTNNLPHYKETLETRIKNAFLVHQFLHFSSDKQSQTSKQKELPVYTIIDIYLVSLR